MPLSDFPRSPVLTRRQTLWAMAGIAVFPTLGLVGCGGGGRGGSKGVSTGVSATSAALPAGFTLPVAELRGETAFGSTSIASNGAFAAKVRANAGPTFAWLRHAATGKYVLFGFAGPGQNGVSAAGSATALLAVVYGVGLLSPDDARALVALIEADPATATLASVIAARVAADPYALTDGDAQVQAAVQVALSSLGGTTEQAVRSKDAVRDDPTPLVSIQPQDQSGSAVLQEDAAPAIFPVNRIRRPAAVYTYQTGIVAADGTATTFPAAVAFSTPQDLAPTTSITASLASLGTRPAFAPVNGSATTLKAYDATATKTLYETVILMASGKVDGIDADPSFFSDPRYASAVAGWKAKRQELNKHAVFGAILFDLFSSVIGGVSTWVSYTVVAAAIADLEVAGADAAQMVVSAATGDVPGATLRWLHGATDVNAIASAPWKRSIAEVLVKAEGFSEAAISAEFLTAIGGIAAYVVGCLVAAGTLLGVADLSSSYLDTLTSDKADLWTATLLKPSVTISPATGTVQAGGSLSLSAGTPGVSETNYKFRWTLDSGGNGNLGDPAGTGGAGRDVTTAGNSISLLTAASDAQGITYTITVEAIELKTGASLGVAKAKIAVGNLDSFVNGSLFITSGPNVESTAPGAEIVYVYVRFTPVAGATTYTLRVDDPTWPYQQQTKFTYASLLPTTTLDGTGVGNAILVELDQTNVPNVGEMTTAAAIADKQQEFSKFNYRVEAT